MSDLLTPCERREYARLSRTIAATQDDSATDDVLAGAVLTLWRYATLVVVAVIACLATFHIWD